MTVRGIATLPRSRCRCDVPAPAGVDLRGGRGEVPADRSARAAAAGSAMVVFFHRFAAEYQVRFAIQRERYRVERAADEYRPALLLIQAGDLERMIAQPAHTRELRSFSLTWWFRGARLTRWGGAAALSRYRAEEFVPRGTCAF